MSLFSSRWSYRGNGYVQPVTCSVFRMTACSAELNLGDTQKMRFYFNYNGVIKAQEA